MRKSKFERESERVQKCADELCEVCKRHDVADCIEALGATLATYLVHYGGQPALEHYLGFLIDKAKRNADDDYARAEEDAQRRRDAAEGFE